jgi:hypothetical protein
VSKSVTVQIALDDLELLRSTGYALCFARCVDNSYNVIWQSFADYLASNSFGWSDQFKLFGTNVFNAGEPMGSRTNAVDIGLYQQATLDASGVLGAAMQGGATDCITMINQYGPIHPALICTSTGPDAIARATPIYVARKAIVQGLAPLHPVDKIQVWFQQNAMPRMMLLEAVSNAIVVDLTNADKASVLYQNGNWITPVSPLQS